MQFNNFFYLIYYYYIILLTNISVKPNFTFHSFNRPLIILHQEYSIQYFLFRILFVHL